IAAMSEATAIERAVADTPPERFELAPGVASCVAAYRDVYRRHHVRLTGADTPGTVNGSPDLVAHRWGRRVDTAVSFGPAGRPSGVALERENAALTLTARTTGPPLPERMRARLFDSLVSVREAGGGERRHLGLGLSIAALI